MFGPLGGQEFILILVLALLLFGPRKLPQVGRTLGRALAEFRGATNDFKRSLEREIDSEEVKEAREGIVSAGREVADSIRDCDVPLDRKDAAPPARSHDGESSERS